MRFLAFFWLALGTLTFSLFVETTRRTLAKVLRVEVAFRFSGVNGLSRMPSSTLIPFLGGLGSLTNPFKQNRAPFLSLGYWAT